MKPISTYIFDDKMKLENHFTNIEDLCNILHLMPVATDMVSSLCGEKLGSGVYRSVHNFNIDPKCVIKIEPLNTQCNVTEYLLWNEIQHLCGDLAWVKDWFAPVKWISPNGRLLVMEKTFDKPKKKKPEFVPKFMWDVKPDNFGWIGNKYVCHDYGQFYNFISYGREGRGLKKAFWE